MADADVLIVGAGAAGAACASALAEAGRTVAPRGDTTLVAWESPDPEAERDRLTEAGQSREGTP